MMARGQASVIATTVVLNYIAEVGSAWRYSGAQLQSVDH